MSPINAVAQSGFSSADSYDAHRPSYNPAAVEFLISTLGLAGKSQAKLAEIASGTGKFTSLLSARPENFETIAVEPHGQMREVLQKKALQGVAVREGNALAVPIEDGWADSVIAAQAFHWFATAEALQEFGRILRPHGSLGFIWNVEDYNQARTFACATAWETAMRDLNWKYTTDTAPRFKDGKWKAVFEEKSEDRFHRPIHEKLFREKFWVTREGLWKRWNTLSNIANLNPQDNANLRVQFDKVLDNAEDLVTNERGEIEIHSTCIVAWTALRQILWGACDGSNISK
ncbi:putative 2-heptaprenyl-1,4-naphthoquinone methyltransferase [Sphaerosporella brunnea]|uniref:Putative 2-heptaprenyl-1,4-naphthoquinone methyltransferase n=1 Tax=Sphaerosporella brunnea TaxID=1250544 RepID=A0A5J5EHR0_9PEZI|nr:putative 2-heptaprenyl-1,4-naphthoquinone methyltransferase [Sphaerosporella brunnea]